jgi:hypothetical protein
MTLFPRAHPQRLHLFLVGCFFLLPPLGVLLLHLLIGPVALLFSVLFFAAALGLGRLRQWVNLEKRQHKAGVAQRRGRLRFYARGEKFRWFG